MPKLNNNAGAVDLTNVNELSVVEPRSGGVNAASRLSFVENNNSSTLIAINNAHQSSIPGTVKRKAQVGKMPDVRKESALALKRMVEEVNTESKHSSQKSQKN